MAKLRSVSVGPNVQADGLFTAFARTPLLESIEVDGANQNYQSLVGNGLDTIELGSQVTELWMTPRETSNPAPHRRARR